MKKAFSLALLLFGMACLSFAAPLKVDPGSGMFATASTFEVPVSQGILPAISADAAQTSVSFLAAGAVFAAVALFIPQRRKPKSPLLRMRGSAVLSYLKSLKVMIRSRLFAYRAKSPWLKSQGSSDLEMLTA